MEIDPTHLNKHQKYLLSLLLEQNNYRVLKAGIAYPIAFYTHESSTLVEDKITLTHTLYKHLLENNPDVFGYDILDKDSETAFNTNSLSITYKKLGRLTLHDNTVQLTNSAPDHFVTIQIMEIDPTHLTRHQKYLLSLLLKQDKNGVLEADMLYPIFLHHPKGTVAKQIEITLTHTLYKHPLEGKPEEFGYDIINEESEPFQTGSCSMIYNTLGTLTLHRNTVKWLPNKTYDCLTKVQELQANYEKIESKRFYQKLMAETHNEARLANLAGSAHMTKPTFLFFPDQKVIKTYATMKKRRGESVFDVINDDFISSPRYKLTTLQRLEVTLSMLIALRDMHEKYVIHRDIKPENMFYQRKKNKIKFIDFGYSKIRGQDDNGGRGTPGYIPPEIHFGEQSDEKSDVYSIGAVIAILWGNDAPQGEDELDLTFSTLFKRTNADFTILEKIQFKDWLTQITQPDRDYRMSDNEAIDALEMFIKLYKENRLDSIKKSGHNLFHLFKQRTPTNDSAITEQQIPTNDNTITTPRTAANKSM